MRRALTSEPDIQISRSTTGCARSEMSRTVILLGWPSPVKEQS
jgi:hypothetical protein